MMSDNLPTMAFRSKSTATTYSFGVNNGYGWALCSVNDTTGELNIMSDWGNWAYRWGPHFGGQGPTLTHFIAGRSDGACHYLADKLTSDDRSKREAFSGEKTVASLREYICQRRRESPDHPKLDAATARQLYDDLGETLTHDDRDDARDFVARVWDIENHDLVFDASDDLRYEKTGSYMVLLKSIIPALVAACDATVFEREALLDQAYVPEPEPGWHIRGNKLDDKTSERGITTGAEISP